MTVAADELSLSQLKRLNSFTAFAEKFSDALIGPKLLQCNQLLFYESCWAPATGIRVRRVPLFSLVGKEHDSFCEGSRRCQTLLIK